MSQRLLSLKKQAAHSNEAFVHKDSSLGRYEKKKELSRRSRRKRTQSTKKDLGEGDIGILGEKRSCLATDEGRAAGPKYFEVLGKNLHFSLLPTKRILFLMT